MTLTLLLDLDDTLLGNKIEPFVAVYSRALAKHLAGSIEPQLLVKSLMEATLVMIANQRPDRTLEETFDAAFYPAIGIEKEKIRPTFDSFYRDVFPTLQYLTQSWPQAVELVEAAFKRGYRVGIATNPLFPRTAILQRLAWAGLPADRYPFALIPSYETFHFAKPNPAFYAEYVARLGWPEGPVVMVGDSLDNDIIAAKQLGLATYWIPQNGQTAPSGKTGPDRIGNHQEILEWLDSIPEEQIVPSFSSQQAYQSILRSTPAAIDYIKRVTPLNLWIQRPQPEEWCLAEIICHLRDVDIEVNLPRMEKITQELNPFLPGMDTDPWANTRQYIAQDCVEAYTAFTEARIRLLEILDRLSAEDWKRMARHAIFGPTVLEEMVNIIAGHDRLHIQQIHKVLQVVTSPVK